MTDQALFCLQEGQVISYVELISMPVVFRASAIRQFRQRIRDVVVRCTLAAYRRTPSEQLGVNVQQFRVSIAGIKLQAVAHALGSFENKRIIVGANAVRAIVKGRVEAVGTDKTQRRIVTVTVYSVYILEHRQMTAQRPLVLGAEEQPPEELAFHAQVEILARGVAHVDVHESGGNTLPPGTTRGYTRGIRNGSARTSGIIPRPDGRGTGIEDSVATVCAKIEQGIERRVPGAVGPDVIEDPIVEDAVAPTNRHLAFAKGIPGKAEARPKIMVLCVPHPADWTCARCGNACGIRG